MAIDVDAPFTELEAVNEMLYDLGARTVTVLTGTLRQDVQKALDTLRRVTRDLCTRGYWFNTTRVKLDRDVDKYPIDPTWVHVEVVAGGPTTGQYNEKPHLVVRGDGAGGRELFDRANNTNTFSAASELTLIVHELLAYEDLPESARAVAYSTAAVRYQSRELGSRAVSAELRDQQKASASLLAQEDIDNENINVTTSPRFVTMMWNP